MEIAEWVRLIRTYLPEIVIAALCATVVHLWRALRAKDAQTIDFLLSIVRGARRNGSVKPSLEDGDESLERDSSREQSKH